MEGGHLQRAGSHHQRQPSVWVKDPHPFWGVGVATPDQISLPVSSSNAFVIYPRADSDSVLEPPSAGDLNRRTMNSPHRWLFMYPGSIERTQHLLEREGKGTLPGPRSLLGGMLHVCARTPDGGRNALPP
jgi:hypothetical protein